MEQFLQFNKFNGMYVGNSALPDLDPAFGNTEVLLPGEEFVDGIVYVFDESIQMWRTLTLEQFEQRLNKIIKETPSNVDEFMATTAAAIAEMTKSNMLLMATITKQSKKLDALEKRILILEPKGDE